MAKTEHYKLKDSSTTFYDPETKFKVAADQVVEIGPKGKGKLTLAAINAGGLIEVNRESKPAKETDPKTAAKDKGK